MAESIGCRVGMKGLVRVNKDLSNKNHIQERRSAVSLAQNVVKNRLYLESTGHRRGIPSAAGSVGANQANCSLSCLVRGCTVAKYGGPSRIVQ